MTLAIRGLVIEDKSIVEHGGTTYFLARNKTSGEKWLGLRGETSGFAGKLDNGTLICPLSPENAAALRTRLPWLNPVRLGLSTSAGFGDRLGEATPGHVQAVRGTGIAPIFAQQSVRENARTGRTPQQVMDDAMWGVFQAGWSEAWGADADHLKTPDVIAPFVSAGYSFFTVDPGDHVDNRAESDSLPVLREKAVSLPWDELDSTPDDLNQRFLGKELAPQIVFTEENLLRAVVKYGKALAHIVSMHRHLKSQMGGKPFDFEVSVDETDSPTTIHEHFFLAAEMRRLNVEWVSLAPRFVGRFEKGVDYIGDLAELDRCLAGHAVVMKHFGGYKLSLHSGSDKFSVYPLVARHAGNLVHLKTAGTSYLEALRTWAEADPAAFRTILDFARSRYATDCATYHVSADLSKVPPANTLSDAELPDLLNQFDARQVLHVTFGSVLAAYGPDLHSMLRTHEERYFALLKRHFARHLDPFH